MSARTEEQRAGQREAARQRRANNPEAAREASRRSHAARRDQDRAYSARYYAENLERLRGNARERSALRRQADPEQGRAASRQYYEANREAILARRQAERLQSPGLRQRRSEAAKVIRRSSSAEATRNSLAWSGSEDALLARLVGEGRTSREIAFLIGRTPAAVDRRRYVVAMRDTRSAA